MRKSVVYVSCLIIAVGIVFVGCKKGNIEPSTQSQQSKNQTFQSMENQIQELSKKYSVNEAEKAKPKPKWWATVLVDAGGAWQGGEAGSVFPGWGTFIGAVVGGVGSSAVYAWGLGTSHSDTSSSVTPPIENPINPFEIIGITHNKLLSSAIKNSNKYYNSETKKIDTMTLINDLSASAVYEWNTNNGDSKSIKDVFLQFHSYENAIFKAVGDISSNPYSELNYSNSYMVNDLVNMYIDIARLIDNPIVVMDFSRGFESIIVNSFMDECDKNEVLIFVATYKYSMYYWN